MLFLLFFVSGFSSLLYQVVWTRMAFAAFGIITPVLSVVLSVFMAGLALGSWAAGRCVGGWVARTGRSAALLYAGAELVIGAGAFAVPACFGAGQSLLLAAGQSNSIAYLALSALVLALSILPWCVAMGATFPLMMAYVRERDARAASSFSYLYLANVLGAMCGTLVTAVVLVELLGFRQSLLVAAAGNAAVALAALWLGTRSRPPARPLAAPAPATAGRRAPAEAGVAAILFSTGFCAMALEVVWTRAFTHVLHTQVYSFAAVVFTYLGATFVGSALYRRALRRGRSVRLGALLVFLAVAALLPVIVNDTRYVNTFWADWRAVASQLAVLASICPLCAGLGYLTPRLVDSYSGGDPRLAGRAYAINVIGCILGPLCACYCLLPWLGERHVSIVLALPLVLLAVLRRGGPAGAGAPAPAALPWMPGRALGLAALAAALLWSTLVTVDYDTLAMRVYPKTQIRRDHAASVVATGEGRAKWLLVNGIGMTTLTPITKFMVHLPLGMHRGRPKSVLIICFGMGTTFRSALSWGVETTAVELIASVRDSFPYYHDDALVVTGHPLGRVVIDDGRRFLARTQQSFDVIVIDPPPPIQAAGSSLLYSEEFYELAKRRLNPGGILQAWLPDAPQDTAQAVMRAVRRSFPHVRQYLSVEGWGLHMLASRDPIEVPPAEELARRLPPLAQKDLLEWCAASETVASYLGRVLTQENPERYVLRAAEGPSLSDDRPFNEYYLLRDWRRRGD